MSNSSRELVVILDVWMIRIPEQENKCRGLYHICPWQESRPFSSKHTMWPYFFFFGSFKIPRTVVISNTVAVGVRCSGDYRKNYRIFVTRVLVFLTKIQWRGGGERENEESSCIVRSGKAGHINGKRNAMTGFHRATDVVTRQILRKYQLKISSLVVYCAFNETVSFSLYQRGLCCSLLTDIDEQ